MNTQLPILNTGSHRLSRSLALVVVMGVGFFLATILLWEMCRATFSYWLLLPGFFLLILVMGIFHYFVFVRWKSLTQRFRTHSRENHRQLRTLASELVVAEEAQRRRIAEDIHDNIGQSLSIALLKLAAVKSTVPAGVPEQAIEDVSDLIQTAAEDLRSTTFDLSSPVLYKLGLEEAVEDWLTEEIEKQNGITYTLTRENSPPPLADKLKVLLFRAIREVLVNIVKHARASHVDVHIAWTADEARITIRDDGVGFDPSAKPPLPTRKGGFGLLSIRERLNYLGGQLEVCSEPGRGTRAVLTIPCRKSAAGESK